MARARAYAAVMGGGDVRVLEISENIRSSARLEAMAPRAMASDAIQVSASPVQPGRVSTGVSIGMKFEVVSEDDEEEEGEG